MIIDWTDFWNWRKALTTDAAKRPLPGNKKPWPAMINAPSMSNVEWQKYWSKLVSA